LIREDGRGLTKDDSTKSPLGIEISTKKGSNCHGVGLGTESSSWRKSLRRGKLLRREGVTGELRDSEKQSKIDFLLHKIDLII
jgi:hypothetical protein